LKTKSTRERELVNGMFWRREPIFGKIAKAKEGK